MEFTQRPQEEAQQTVCCPSLICFIGLLIKGLLTFWMISHANAEYIFSILETHSWHTSCTASSQRRVILYKGMSRHMLQPLWVWLGMAGQTSPTVEMWCKEHARRGFSFEHTSLNYTILELPRERGNSSLLHPVKFNIDIWHFLSWSWNSYWHTSCQLRTTRVTC